MYHAYAAKMRSACLSRQVGAAIIDFRYNLIATGTNEAPKGGGGLYVDGDSPDFRCAYHSGGTYCRNTREQIDIIADLFKLDELKDLTPERKQEVERFFRKSRIGGLLEFSRAVHAEMDAIIAAARTGNSLVGSRLFVTTFPCHYCARHIVAAGVDEVQFIEPYPKSRALLLHSDSITLERSKWVPPSTCGTGDKGTESIENTESARVLFRQFTGIAPRRYEDAFLKVSELKDQNGNMIISDHDWLQPWDILHQSYIQAEMQLEAP
jgi:deoxycytidylate deaminase